MADPRLERSGLASTKTFGTLAGKSEEWLLARVELIGTDGVHPTDAGHAYLADLIEPIVREALVGEPVA